MGQCCDFMISRVWRREQNDKTHHRLWCKFIILLRLRWCTALIPQSTYTLFVNEKPFDQKWITKFSKDSLNGKVLEFTQVDTEVPYELYVEINQMALLFVVQEISDCNITKTMKMYKEKTDRKTIKVTKNLVGVIRAKTMLLYPPVIR